MSRMGRKIYHFHYFLILIQDAIGMIKTTPGTVFFGTPYLINQVNMKHPSLYSLGGETLAIAGILIKKNSLLLRFMNPILTKMRESGRLDQIIQNVVSKGISIQSSIDTNDPLSFNDIFTWFGLYYLGVAFGLIILAVELYTHNK
jgi:hypothetical protein